MSITWDELDPQPEAGAALVITVSVIDSAGAAVNITGWTWEFWLTNVADAAEAYDLSARLTTVNAATGQEKVTLLRADTVDLAGKRFLAEFWRVDGNNDAIIAKGFIQFAAVARSTAEA